VLLHVTHASGLEGLQVQLVLLKLYWTEPPPWSHAWYVPELPPHAAVTHTVPEELELQAAVAATTMAKTTRSDFIDGSPIDVDHARPVSRRFVGREPPVAGEDDEVPRLHEVRGGAVDADLARPALAGDDVRRQPRAVGHVVDVDLLVLDEAGGLREVEVDRDGADVVEVGAGDGGAMELAEEEVAQHGLPDEDEAPRARSSTRAMVAVHPEGKEAGRRLA
jgi:hypothetical protein